MAFDVNVHEQLEFIRLFNVFFLWPLALAIKHCKLRTIRVFWAVVDDGPRLGEVMASLEILTDAQTFGDSM